MLTIQRAAFVSEALIYGDPDMPPLVQTLEELEAELDGLRSRGSPGSGGRLVGVLRCRETDDLLLIGRIAIAPDMQGSGIGRALLEAAEQHSTAPEAELFTGSLSEANIRLYEDCGYRITEQDRQRRRHRAGLHAQGPAAAHATGRSRRSPRLTGGS